MRKTIGFVLLALGAALLAVGVVTTTWAPGVVKKTPIDVNTKTYLEGTASRLGAEERPIRIFSLNRADSEESDDSKAVFVSVQCVTFTDEGDVPDCGDKSVDQATDGAGETDGADGTDPRVLTITTDRFVTDRKTALAVSEDGIIEPEYVVASHEGVVNKFPFDTEKKSYPFWDGLTGQSWQAEFVGEEKIQGLDVYHFSVSIDDEPAEVSPGIQGTYSNQIEVYVEPKTGGIVRQSQAQQRFIDGEPALDLKADYTEDQLTTSIDEAKDNVASLELVTKTMPIVGFVGGVLLLLAGAAVILLGRRRRGAHAPADRDEREPATV